METSTAVATKIRGVGYARQSKTKDKSESREVQVEAIQRAADHYGVDLVSILVEPPSTGAYKDRGRNRPKFLEVLDIIATGEADAIVGYTTARVTRGGAQGWADIFDIAEKRALNPDRFVLTAGSGWLSEFELSIRAAMDREQSKKTSEALCDMKERHARQGRPAGGGTRAYGWAKDKVTPVPEEIEIIQDMAARFLAGEGVRSIARSLNEQGKLTATGKEWGGETVRNLLMNPRIAGLRAHMPVQRQAELRAAGDKPYRHLTTTAIVGPATWDPAIPRATWDAVVAKMKANATGPAEPSPYRHPFSAFIHCAKCGGKMTVCRTEKEPTPRIKCLKRPAKPNCGGMSITNGPVAALLEAMLLYRLNSKPVVDALFGQAAEEVTKQNTAMNEITECESKMATLSRQWASGDLDDVEWKAARGPLVARLEAARARLSADDDSLAVKALLDASGDIAEQWNELPVTRKYAVAKALIDKVVIHPHPNRGSKDLRLEDRVQVIWKV